MTEEQFKQYMAVEIAKLAALQGINNAAQALAGKQGVTGTHANWNDVAAAIKEGLAQIGRLAPGP